MSLFASFRPFFKTLKSIVATELRWDSLYTQKSYSQEGEDIVLRKIFDGKKDGFYVDIGAHHPYRYSNTHYFYKLGWRGINVDATPGSMAPFRLTRKRDTNLETIVGNTKEKITYYVFADSALNTTSKDRAETVQKTGQSRLLQTIDLSSDTLSHILTQYLPLGTTIDFLSLDVEGAELDVLESNNWKSYQPTVIIVEMLTERSIEEILKDPATVFLKKQGYEVFARTFNSVFFRLKKR